MNALSARVTEEVPINNTLSGLALAGGRSLLGLAGLPDGSRSGVGGGLLTRTPLLPLSWMIRGLYLENGNRDQNLVYKIQWGSGVLPRYTSSILGLCYAIQVIMERRRNGGGKGEGGERCV